MPGGDRTGPMGMGAMTGRGAGYCAGYSAPGYMNPMPGRGFGFDRGRGGRGGRRMGGGFGAGWGNPWAAAPYAVPGYPYGGGAASYGAPTPAQETQMLKAQARQVEDELDGIRRRLAELETESGDQG